MSGLKAKPIRDRRSVSTSPGPQGVGFHIELKANGAWIEFVILHGILEKEPIAMKDEDRTKGQLLEEIIEMRRYISQMEKSESGCKPAEAEELYETLAESSLAAVFIVQDGKFRFINTSAIAYAGYTAEELIGQDSYTIVHPEDRAKVKRLAKEMLAEAHNTAFEYRIVTKQNDIRWISQAVTPIRYGGKPAILGNAIDVTELKQAERLYETLAESSLAAVFIVQEGKFCFINTSAVAYTGYTAEELIGQGSYIIVHPEDRAKVKRLAKEMLAGARNAAFEYRIVTKLNDIRWISQAVTPIRYGGKPAILGNAIDVTELKQAEEALREGERLYNIILGSPFPAFAIGNDHRIIHWNQAMEELSGIKAEDAIGTIQDLSMFYGTERPRLAYLLVDELIEAIPQYYSGKYVKSGLTDGSYETTDFFPEMGQGGLWIRFTATAVRDSKGNVIGAIETLEDVTSKKRAEEVREKLILELKDAMSKIKTLSGMLPICASCKKIRDDKGYWNQIESYIKRHSEAEFSHSICPECAKILYPKHYKRMYPEHDK